MKNLGSRFLATAAIFLAPIEREAVLGDLFEIGEDSWRALWEVLGLVLRRQAGLWLNWRPWLAAFGVALPGSLFLMGTSVSISLAWVQLGGGMAAAGQFVSPGAGILSAQVVLLVAWSWSGGFALGSISRPTLWASAVASGLPCLFCLSRFQHESLSRFCLLLFLVPAISGVRSGLRLTRLHRVAAWAIATIVTVALLPLWRNGAAGGNLRAWVWAGALCWPAWYLVATACGASDRAKANL
jgi:hypothetical protein